MTKENAKISTNRIRELVESQGAGTLEDRQAYYDKAEQDPLFGHLMSVLTSIAWRASNSEHTEPSELTGKELGRLYRELGLNINAAQAILARLLGYQVLGKSSEDAEKIATFAVEQDLVLTQGMCMHLAFLLGYLYHDRNTTLVDDLLADAKGKNAKGS